jgi:hypothetical protein
MILNIVDIEYLRPQGTKRVIGKNSEIYCILLHPKPIQRCHYSLERNVCLTIFLYLIYLTPHPRFLCRWGGGGGEGEVLTAVLNWFNSFLVSILQSFRL